MQDPLEAKFQLNSWILSARNGSMLTTNDCGMPAGSPKYTIALSRFPCLRPDFLNIRCRFRLLATGPWSHPTFPGYKAVLPTSLTHIEHCSTRDSRPRRPDAVSGTNKAFWCVSGAFTCQYHQPCIDKQCPQNGATTISLRN